MDYPVKILTLYKNFYYSADAEISVNHDETMTRWRTSVTKYNGSPKPEQFLTEPYFCGYAVSPAPENTQGLEVLAAAKYMFIQKLYTSTDEAVKTAQERSAAEELYLEALWQEQTFADDIFYMRRLEEDNKHVFQLFRKITA